ncbi:MAG: hypothetical protein U0359_11505 [Byssovorax sp.]
MRKPEIAEMSTKLLLVELGSNKRMKRIFLFGGIGIVVLAGAAVAVIKTIDAQSAAARDAAYSSLSACLLGEPLKQDETVESRLLGVQLAVLGIAKDRRAKPGELSWPASCSVPAATLGEHAGDAALAESAVELSKALRADSAGIGDHRALVAKVWKDAAAQKLVVGPAPAGVTAAPKPATPVFAGEAFRGLPHLQSGSYTLANVHGQPFAGNKVHFVIDRKESAEGPLLCTATATEPSMHCMRVPPAVATLSPGLGLVGTTDDGARPFFFAGDRGQMGIFPPDGKAAVAGTIAYGASARNDGSLNLLYRKDNAKDLRFSTIPATGPEIDRLGLLSTEVELPTQAGVFFDWLAYRSPAKGAAPSHLFAKKLADNGDPRPPAIDIGEIAEPAPLDKADKEPQLAACRSEESLVLRVRGARADSFSFYTGGRWGAPVKGSSKGGALTCRGIEAVSTAVDHAIEGDKNYATVNQSRCNASGCTPVSVGLRQLFGGTPEIAPADAAGFAAADVGGKLLLVWNAGFTGGLRMRIAPPDRIREAEDVVITDGRDPKPDSKLSTIAEVKILPANSYAVVLLNTTAGVTALRVDANGAVASLQSGM